jgi:hypothetical protein
MLLFTSHMSLYFFVLRVNDRLCGESSKFLATDPEVWVRFPALERDTLSLVSATEELLGRKSSSSGLEIREYGRRDPSR